MDRGLVGPAARTSCPICESTQTPSRLAFWENLSWWSCASCGGGWREPYVPENEAQDMETARTYGRYIDNRLLFETVAAEKVAWIGSAARLESASVLEVGPGTGAVADALVAAGLPRHRYAALESNKVFADSLAARGFVVFRGTAWDALQAASEFLNGGSRAVVLFDNVLEHVPRPRELLVSLRDSLHVPFTVLIEVPNEKGLGWRAPLQDVLRGMRKPPTFPGHINLFTRSSLARLLRDVFTGEVSVHPKGLRHPDEVRRLLQSHRLPPAVRVALALLNVMPIDRMLGVAYFLRAEVQVLPLLD